MTCIVITIFSIITLCMQTEGFIASHLSGTKSNTESKWALRLENGDWIIDDDDYYFGDNIKETSRSKNESQKSNQPERIQHDDNQQIRTYFATCIPGLHNTLASELSSLGASRVETKGNSGVSFSGSSEIGLKSILWCRTAHRIMELVASTDDDDYYNYGIRDGNELYEYVKSSLHTPSLLGNGSGGLLTLSVSTIYTSKVPKELCHTHYTALTVKNALVDAVRDLREDGMRPDVDTADADVPIVVVLRGRRLYNHGREKYKDFDRKNERSNSDRFEQDEELLADVDIYRCLHSGGSLHRRGYRGSSNVDDDCDDSTPIHRAAMKESLAAGLLLEAGWDKLIAATKTDNYCAVLVDPMTGSATLPTEAALIACDMAPGLSRIASYNGKQPNPYRIPPSVRWKDFSSVEVWNELLAEAASRAKRGVAWARNDNVSIFCNEKNPRAAALARSSIKKSGVGSIISLEEGDCLDWKLDNKVVEGRTIFVCNPPWGIRLTQDIDDSWVSLREFLRREGNGAEAWVLSGNKDLTKILRMKKSQTVVLKTAEEDLRWLQYHIFQREPVPLTE